ncbi:MAG: site-specific DNA-methyltransferase [Candidatus Saccharibacteria bacterium]|nr:site-specific DNA-methyltransferase [Candidatus Saccharibacteria bacterium]
MRSSYKTKFGQVLQGDSLQLLEGDLAQQYRNKFQLIITSPPFPLNRKKQYGNLQSQEYKKWFIDLGQIFQNLLKEDGSLVIELGNAWQHKRPVQSLLHLESLLGLVQSPDNDLRLIQEFICYNPSRLPSPAQWVTVNRIRTIDSYTHVWWLAKSDYPKADNSKILRPYSRSMQSLLKRQSFNDGPRPSGHNISKSSFLTDHQGSIMPNFLEFESIDADKEPRLPHNILSFGNSVSNDNFLRRCRQNNIQPHPARMSPKLVNFFIEFLTDPSDSVLDPFAGSNTTGYCAEKKKRQWLAIEIDKQYCQQSKLRFADSDFKKPSARKLKNKNRDLHYVLKSAN